jgi:SAM-dependent methyltransferase
MKHRCVLCRSENLFDVTNRPSVAVHQHLLMDSPAEARGIRRGELVMAVCGNCGFFFNRAFDAVLLSYGAGYDNAQGHSPAFREYMENLAGVLIRRRGLRDSHIVEIGCGKGEFLRMLCNERTGNTGVGFDPSYAGPDRSDCGRIEFHREFFSPAAAEGKADVILCRHLIEHIDEPLEMFRTIATMMRANPGSRVFIETPCAEWILANQVIWDLFYEHCSLFCAESLAGAMGRCGIAAESIDHVFGGQYLLAEGRCSRNSAVPASSVTDLVIQAREFARVEAQTRDQWRRDLDCWRQSGAVALWGAGAKGVTLANLVDPDCRMIDSVVDVNPNKIGRFLPGSGHPIVDFHDLARRGVRRVVLMNPNYRSEVLDMLESCCPACELICQEQPA